MIDHFMCRYRTIFLNSRVPIRIHSSLEALSPRGISCSLQICLLRSDLDIRHISHKEGSNFCWFQTPFEPHLPKLRRNLGRKSPILSNALKALDFAWKAQHQKLRTFPDFCEWTKTTPRVRRRIRNSSPRIHPSHLCHPYQFPFEWIIPCQLFGILAVNPCDIFWELTNC